MANFIVFDCETTPLNKGGNRPNPRESLIYDAGWVVADESGATICERSFVVSEVFFDLQKMTGAYYADKMAVYRASYNDGGAFSIQPFSVVWAQLREDCERYDVDTIWAYNAFFDRTALAANVGNFSNGFIKTANPVAGLVWRDVWRAAMVITGSDDYVQWAYANGFTTSSGNPSTTAECVYRYVTGDITFVESHTGRNDATIELAILNAARELDGAGVDSFAPANKLMNGYTAAARTARKLGLASNC